MIFFNILGQKVFLLQPKNLNKILKETFLIPSKIFFKRTVYNTFYYLNFIFSRYDFAKNRRIV